MKDIQTLNEEARKGTYDVTAISFHAYAYVADKYALLPHGASIGDNYGPIVVAHNEVDASQISELTIAIPGTLTSAFLTLRLYNPNGPDQGSAFFGGPKSSGPFDGLQAEYARVPFANVGPMKLPEEISRVEGPRDTNLLQVEPTVLDERYHDSGRNERNQRIPGIQPAGAPIPDSQ